MLRQRATKRSHPAEALGFYMRCALQDGRGVQIIRAKWSLVGSLSDRYLLDKYHYSSAITPACHYDSQHSITEACEGRGGVSQSPSPPFKIQLNFDFVSFSQTHSARHRSTLLRWRTRLSLTLVKTFILECRADLNLLGAAGAWTVNWFTRFDGHPGKDDGRERHRRRPERNIESIDKVNNNRRSNLTESNCLFLFLENLQVSHSVHRKYSQIWKAFWEMWMTLMTQTDGEQLHFLVLVLPSVHLL